MRKELQETKRTSFLHLDYFDLIHTRFTFTSNRDSIQFNLFFHGDRSNKQDSSVII